MFFSSVFLESNTTSSSLARLGEGVEPCDQADKKKRIYYARDDPRMSGLQSLLSYFSKKKKQQGGEKGGGSSSEKDYEEKVSDNYHLVNYRVIT